MNLRKHSVGHVTTFVNTGKGLFPVFRMSENRQFKFDNLIELGKHWLK